MKGSESKYLEGLKGKKGFNDIKQREIEKIAKERGFTKSQAKKLSKMGKQRIQSSFKAGKITAAPKRGIQWQDVRQAPYRYQANYTAVVSYNVRDEDTEELILRYVTVISKSKWKKIDIIRIAKRYIREGEGQSTSSGYVYSSRKEVIWSSFIIVEAYEKAA